MKRMICWLLVLLLVPVCAWAEMSVWFLDVGQGDCTVVVCDGMSMIVDGGPPGSPQFVYGFLRDELGIEHLDYMVSTHPHEDHLSGLAAVLNAVPVDLVLSPVTEWNTKRFERFMEYARKQGTPVSVPSVGDQLRLGGATVTVLQCWPEAVLWRENDVNDMSVAVRIDYGETSVVITGDAEEASEYMMMDSGVSLKADVLKVGHHGSTYSTGEAFLKAIFPKYAVISCGEGNEYFHPHKRVLNLLKKNNVWLFRTDLQGTVRCVSDGKEIRFSVDRWADRAELYTAPSEARLAVRK